MSGELWRLAMQRVTRKPDDTEQTVETAACALFGSIESGALRIGVDQRDPLSLPSPLASQMRRERRLDNAALLIEQRDDRRLLPSAVFRRSASHSTSERLDSSSLAGVLTCARLTAVRSR